MDEKLKEIILKFPNGEERFRRSAIFNKIVQALARGADEYVMMDALMEITEDSQDNFRDHLMVCPFRIINPED